MEQLKAVSKPIQQKAGRQPVHLEHVLSKAFRLLAWKLSEGKEAHENTENEPCETFSQH